MPRIAEVALFTEDVERLADFYAQVLGRPASVERARSTGADVTGPNEFYWGAGRRIYEIRTGVPSSCSRRANRGISDVFS